MATNLDILLELKDTIFVEEILSKTRDGGLPWKKADSNRYTVTLCEPPFCLSPYIDGDSWTFNITKLSVGLDYVYVLDVLVNDDTHYLHTNSRSIEAVGTLFVQIEKTIARSCQIDRAIKFISNIPTAPSTDISEFVMCGGASVGGSGRVFAIYNPNLIYGGISGGAQTSPFVVIRPSVSGGADLDGDHTVQAIFGPQTSGGTNEAGTAGVGVIVTRAVSGGSRASGTAVVS